MYTAKTISDDVLDEDIHNAGENLRAGSRRIKKDLHETADAMKEDAEQIARSVGRQVRALADTAEHALGEATHSVSEKIHEKPVQSSLIALGIGVLLGLLFRR